MTLLKQQALFIVVAFISVFIFFLTQENLQNFFALNDYERNLRTFKYVFSAILNYAFISGFYLMIRKTWLTLIVSQFTVFLLTFINIQKERYLSTSLVPSDFLLVSETLKASPLSLKIFVFISLALFFALFIWLYKKEKREKGHIFMTNGVLAVFIIGFFITANFQNNFATQCAKNPGNILCKYTRYLPQTRGDWVGDHLTIRTLGMSTFFFSKSIDNLNDKLFSTEKIPKDQIEHILKTPQVQAKSELKQLPNIIFIMSESHWDATKLDPSVPKNLTPTIQKNQLSQVLSPSFGGGTANVEFEVLTGLNVYLNKNELLYVSKIKRPIYSLPRYFNQLGYSSTAMHNNGKYFYNRSAVYQNLGFQRFISLENMTANPNSAINQGGWATDDLIYDSIKQQLQQSQQPQFIYAITVENHPMYNDDRFGKDKYIINKSGVSAASQRQLNTYLLGMQRADAKFKQLIDMTKQLDRPTMIIFFGDHLPNLQKVYDDFQFFDSEQDKIEKKQAKYFETPLAVWSNFPIDKKQFDSEFIPAHFLASRVLASAGLPLPPYFQFIKNLSKCYPTIHQIQQQATSQCYFDAEKLLSDYKKLNSDVINGSNWTYQLLQRAEDEPSEPQP
ncbi:LTA synthase family protein [Acinetobacter rudis]|uniref:LTA synthase family protein n=1 Tax=Acinetobacter rudis TaxID=632955 RepID=UPI003340F64B